MTTVFEAQRQTFSGKEGMIRRFLRKRLPDLLLIPILALAAYLRFAGMNWDEFTHPHPDERFLTMVESSLRLPQSMAEYFDTANSPLNPHNAGHSFFVYGTLPIFIVRFVAEDLGKFGYDQVHLVGRAAAATFDLVSVFLVYLIGSRLYRRRVGLLAAALSAFSVLLIQHAHFLVVDPFANTFILAGFYFAIRVMDQGRWADYLLFGLSLGVAVASKITAAPLALMIVIASVVRHWRAGWRIPSSIWWEDPAIWRLRPFSERIRISWPYLWPYLAAFVIFDLVTLALARLLGLPPLFASVVSFLVAQVVLWNALDARERARLFRFLIWLLEAVISPGLRLVAAAAVSLVAFRVFQPYAFQGPSFFDVGLNPRWLSNLAEIRLQQQGLVDAPFALQWANRTPILFALQNIVLWGLGLPLGLAAWAGWGWALLRSLRGDWHRHILPVTWTGLYFLWQSTTFTPSMRYQMPIYPTLAILAAWAMWEAWRRTARIRAKTRRSMLRAAVGTGAVAIVGWTAAYAFAFLGIYTRPNTHVAASRWMYQTIPGPINLVVERDGVRTMEPLGLPKSSTLVAGRPLDLEFTGSADSMLRALRLPPMQGVPLDGGLKNLRLTVYEADRPDAALASAVLDESFTEPDLLADLPLDQPFFPQEGMKYKLRLELTPAGALVFMERMGLVFDSPQGEQLITLELPRDFTLLPQTPYQGSFSLGSGGRLVSILLPYLTPAAGGSWDGLSVAIGGGQDGSEAHPTTRQSASSAVESERAVELRFDRPIEIEPDLAYTYQLNLEEGAVRLRGSTIVSESSWDLGLPDRLDGKDGYSGLYDSQNQELYWPDDQNDDADGIPDKLQRLVATLNAGDYLVISTNRQYGTITRVPQRYPLTTAYYRALFGCPEPKSVVACGARATPETVEGQLGYDLIAVFQSDPSIAGLKINDQLAEEAFTVYDHPKVLIFRKAEDFSAESMAALLGQVDVSHVANLLPRDLGRPARDLAASREEPARPTKSLLLPEERLAEQQQNGTWSELFDSASPLNRSGLLATVAWWLAITLIGLIAFPLTRLAFAGLGDGGYPVSRIIGLAVVAWGTWLLGSLRVPFSRATILLVLLGMFVVSAIIAWRRRGDLLDFWKRRKTEILLAEGFALAFFLLDLAIRLGNPDLWHPFKGGEKPMDFSYLNAVLKSTSFPPYDPWFAGGYINYYYYGFVLVATPIRLLGITPSVAYNLVIPTLFSLLALAAYCAGWNLVERSSSGRAPPRRLSNRAAGVFAAVALVLLGNLGTAKMVYDGLKTIGASAEGAEGPLAGPVSAVRGLGMFLTQGSSLPIAMDRWYWDPSRAIPVPPGEVGPITEFPFFTFLYADLHAHMINLPLTLAALVWALARLRRAQEARKGSWLETIVGLFVGGLILGVLRPTNTWDFPVYWTLAVCATFGAALIEIQRIRTFTRPRPFHSEGRDVSSPPLRAANPGSSAHSTGDVERELGYSLMRSEEWGIPSEESAVPDSSAEEGSTWYAGGETGVDALARMAWTLGKGVLQAGVLVGLAYLLYLPYSQWYLQGYTDVDVWRGSRTSLSAYITVHGLSLFILFSWLTWETRQWMAATPLKALARLRPWFGGIATLAFVALAAVLVFAGMGFPVSLLALPLIFWCGILFLRPGMPVEKRAVLCLVGTAAALTVLVEVIVLVGDIGRMNTVFKFYLEVWSLLGISSAAALYWTLIEQSSWTQRWQIGWNAGLALLVFGAALYPLTATPSKIRDRMAADAPHVLDGMAFMPYATQYELDVSFELDEDYEAIRWMQENVIGSPVIVEAHLLEYRWGSRFAIYTGLPAVLGWNWHQRQQRGAVGDGAVESRAKEIADFYTTTSVEQALDFLQKYDVRYVILGRNERIYYEFVKPCWASNPNEAVTCDLSGRGVGISAPPVRASECEPLDALSSDVRLSCPTHGFDKFSAMVDRGILREAFRVGETEIFEVLR